MRRIARETGFQAGGVAVTESTLESRDGADQGGGAQRPGLAGGVDEEGDPGAGLEVGVLRPLVLLAQAGLHACAK